MANEKITDPSEPLDYRLGGETWDSWALKYMATIPYIFKVLNALNGTDDTGLVLPLPSGAGAIVRKNADGSVTINVHGNADSADKLKTARTISLTGKAQGSVAFDGSSNVAINVSNVSGNAESLVGKPINTTSMSDGTIPVYRSNTNQIEFESKGAVGAGRTLTIKNGTDVLGTFSGDVATTVDIGPAINAAVPQTAESAAKLQTARNINGTAFDGSANITTVRWGTARNVYIKDSTSTNTGIAVSVDGSGNINLLLPGTIKANIVGNVTGNTSGSSGSCTGNAATATKLATARAINGTNFDGSDAITTSKWGTARSITIKDATATNAGTATSVDGSGNVVLNLPATIKGNITGNASGSSGSCTGNAATATKLATARTINIQDSSATNTGTGASFDGSGNATIKLPANIKANVTGDVTGNASTATKITGKTVAIVSSFDSSTGVLTLTGLS